MKLFNFLDDSMWNGLRKAMGAELMEFSVTEWVPVDSKDLLRDLMSHGVEVGLEEIEITDDGTFDFQGYKVLVYIRDQRFHPQRDGEYKFHVCNCKVIDEFRKNSRLDRYVASRRTDGQFLVNLFNIVTRRLEFENRIMPMKVCKYCLAQLAYKGYRSYSSTPDIYDDFDLAEFFEIYNDSKFTYTPAHDEFTSPLDDYSRDFPDISKYVREVARWRCANCRISLMDDKRFLHVHHKNGIKSDNRIENLEAVCIGCHGLETGHSRLKFSPDMGPFMAKYGGQWNLGRRKAS